MATWTDTFSSDHFADLTYTLVNGGLDDGSSGTPTEGSEFDIVGGELKITNLWWRDEHSGVIVSHDCALEVDIADAAKVGFLECGFVSLAGTQGVVTALGSQAGTAQLVAAGTAPVSASDGAYTLPGSGALTVAIAVVALTATVKVNGTTVLTLDITPAGIGTDECPPMTWVQSEQYRMLVATSGLPVGPVG